MPGISLAPTLACNALSISSAWASLSSGAAKPVKGAAGITPADARAAARNNASRRVIGPVICVLKMRPLALPTDTTLPALRQAGAAYEYPAEREKLAHEAQDNWLHLFGRNLE